MAIAIFTTWTTYGTWLPGDERGWYKHGEGVRDPDQLRKFAVSLLMNERAISLDLDQRRIVEETIVEHCTIRNWVLHAVNCRTNHVHAVVTAPNRDIEVPREQFKAWCTRKLKLRENPMCPIRENWWTDRGWDEYIDDDASLAGVIEYVMERQ